MILIVDTNRIIAALIKDSFSRQILLSDKIGFVTVGFSKIEIEKHKNEILEKSGLTEEEFEILLRILFRKINILSDLIVEEFMDRAKAIMDNIDPKDTPFISAALAIENQGIWSDDGHFLKQDRIWAWRTEDLVQFLRLK